MRHLATRFSMSSPGTARTNCQERRKTKKLQFNDDIPQNYVLHLYIAKQRSITVCESAHFEFKQTHFSFQYLVIGFLPLS